MLLLRYAIWKVTPVFTTSMKYQRSYIRSQPDELIHCYHDLHSIQSGLNQCPIQCFRYGPWMSARDAAVGFILSALGFWVSCPKDKSRAWFHLQGQSCWNWAASVSRPLSYPDRTLPALPNLRLKLRPRHKGGSHFYFDWKLSQRKKQT